jgi:hypothetical protein
MRSLIHVEQLENRCNLQEIGAIPASGRSNCMNFPPAAPAGLRMHVAA